MSLPPGFLDELRARTSLADVVGKKVIWDTRKSNQGKGDMWAPCPFHQEKTASFHVDDRQGFYYCFGCHAKGDAITFVRETENLGFMEAVEILAGEAGLEMPARDPKAQERADRRTVLAGVMEEAQKYFRLQLKTGAAAEARAYLERRGLSEATQERFGIGFAPEGWQGLWEALTAKGVAAQDILDAGLAKPSDMGREPYDTFRNRIMFPIRDARDRLIAFGGRAMDPDDNAKYLNSPETLLFDKGRSLYNHGPAREAAGKDALLLVAEGYMDVIALSEAGFGATVAPLGTAITEDQLRLLWRMADEPVIALDGDKAGLRAAMRLIDLALPLLEAGKSLRFCLMPEGQDPDDLIRAEGSQAMQALIDAAQPLVNLLWRRETEGKNFDSPERKAALDKDLRAALKTIADPSVRGHYGEHIRQLRSELFGGNRPQGRGDRPWQPRKRGWTPPAQPVPTTRGSLLAGAAGDGVLEELREAVILATLIRHPLLLQEFGHMLEEVEFHAPGHATLAHQLAALDPSETREALADKISASIDPEALESLFAPRHVQLAPPMRNSGDIESARLCLAEELAKLDAARGAAREIAEGMAALEGEADEGVTWRLSEAARARNMAAKPEEADEAEFDIAPSGARIDRDERTALDSLLETIEFDKPGRRRN